MAEYDYIEIDKDSIPYEFDIDLGGVNYTLGVNYNSNGDYFTLDLFKNDIALALGEKICINQIMFKDIFLDKNGNVNPEFPNRYIVVAGDNEKIGRVGYNELGKNVFLYVVDKG